MHRVIRLPRAVSRQHIVDVQPHLDLVAADVGIGGRDLLDVHEFGLRGGGVGRVIGAPESCRCRPSRLSSVFAVSPEIRPQPSAEDRRD